MIKTEELWRQNEALEKTPEYQRVLPEVLKEVYTQFVNERIKSLEFIQKEVNDEGDYSWADDDLPWEPTPCQNKLRKKSF